MQPDAGYRKISISHHLTGVILGTTLSYVVLDHVQRGLTPCNAASDGGVLAQRIATQSLAPQGPTARDL